MKLILRSKVQADMKTVHGRFDADLFHYLLPPGARLLHFGGSKTGDTVHLKLPLVGQWLSEITEDYCSEDLCYFIDEGKILPLPLKAWRHKHVLVRTGTHTVVEDHMCFSTGSQTFDLLCYPFLWLAFVPRTWQYKRYFKAHS